MSARIGFATAARDVLLAQWGGEDGAALSAALIADNACVSGSSVLHACLTARGGAVDWVANDMDVWSTRPLTHVAAWLCSHGATDCTDLAREGSRTSSDRGRISILQFTCHTRTYQLIHVAPSWRCDLVPFCPAAEFDLGCCACTFDGHNVALPPPSIFDISTCVTRIVRWPSCSAGVYALCYRTQTYTEGRGMVLHPDDATQLAVLAQTFGQPLRIARPIAAATFAAMPWSERAAKCQALDACQCAACGGSAFGRKGREMTLAVVTRALPASADTMYWCAHAPAAHEPVIVGCRECCVCGALVCRSCSDDASVWHSPPCSSDDSGDSGNKSKRARLSVEVHETYQHMMCRVCADALPTQPERLAAAQQYVAARVLELRMQVSRQESAERERRETYDIAGLDRVHLLVHLWCGTGSMLSAFGPTPTDDDARARLGPGDTPVSIDYWFNRPLKLLLPALSATCQLVSFVAYNDNVGRGADEAGHLIARMRGHGSITRAM